MTSSFSIPLPSDGWVYLSREEYKVFKTKRLLGMDVIIIEIAHVRTNGVYLKLADHNIKKAECYEDPKNGKHFVQLTL